MSSLYTSIVEELSFLIDRTIAVPGSQLNCGLHVERLWTTGSITADSMSQWAELKTISAGDVNKIIRFLGSPGTVEGTVRVCRTVKDIGELQVEYALDPERTISRASRPWARSIKR